VKVVAYPTQKFEGKVDWVSGALDPTTRTAKVRCTFDNPERILKPEMYATVQVSVDEKRALAVPRDSLVHLGDQTIVFVSTGVSSDGRMKYMRVPVDVDEGESGAWVVVNHGLQPGQVIVTSGALLLSGML